MPRLSIYPQFSPESLGLLCFPDLGLWCGHPDGPFNLLMSLKNGPDPFSVRLDKMEKYEDLCQLVQSIQRDSRRMVP